MHRPHAAHQAHCNLRLTLMPTSSHDRTSELLRGAIQLVTAGQAEAARRIVDEVLQRDETNSAAWIIAARLAEDTDEEATCLGRAVACASLNGSPANEEAAAFARQKLDRLIGDLGPTDVVGRAELLLLAGQHAEARRLLDEMLERHQSNGPAWLLAARLAETRADVRRCLRRAAASPWLDDTPANREAAGRAQASLTHLKPDDNGGSGHGLAPPRRATGLRGWLRGVDAGSWAARLGLRLLSSVALLVALIFFVSLAMELALRGGFTAFRAAFPAALNFSRGYLASLFGQGELIDVPDLPLLLSRSLGLLAVALLVAVAAGLMLGGLAALWRSRRGSRALLFASLLGVSTPSFLVAMLLLWGNIWLGQRLGFRVLPAFGTGWDLHMILPTIVLAALPTASIARLGYNALVGELDADYVRTAHAKGLPPRVVFFGHAVRAAGVELLTLVGVSVRFSLASLPIIEYIFAWRGIGMTLLEAIQQGDPAAAITMILPLALLFILVDVVLEAAYGWIDPRVWADAGSAA